MTAPEFGRPERLEAIGVGERTVVVEAETGERAALAERFALRAVEALRGAFTLRREATGIRVRGRVTAGVLQECSVTGEPLPAAVDEAIDLIFAEPPADTADEVELSDDAIDVVFHDSSAIDLGEIAAETMALALDPFPRGPGADAALKRAGVLSEGQAGPFGSLAALLKPTD